MLGDLIYAPFSHDSLDLMSFQGHFQTGLFCDSVKFVDTSTSSACSEEACVHGH